MTFPHLEELLTKTPLYAPILLENDDKDQMVDLRSGDIQIDCFCLSCEKETVHKTKRITASGSGFGTPSPPRDWMFKDGCISTQLFCARCGHAIITQFSVRNRTLIKWGQLPSVADLSGAELRAFRKVLYKDDYAELNKAIGLISHGVGIGAFVYLRLIFERLVSTYETEARQKGILVEDSEPQRMREKVSALKDILPRAVYDYRDAYSILSLGIHELSENDCKTAFPVIYAVVRLMLEEEVHKRQRERVEADLKKQFKDIKSELNDTTRGRQADEI